MRVPSSEWKVIDVPFSISYKLASGKKCREDKESVNLISKEDMWQWADNHFKKIKGRKLHKSIVKPRTKETLSVGECAVFLSIGAVEDRPYIGRIYSMWENGSGICKVGVMWFYHAAEALEHEKQSLTDKHRINSLKSAVSNATMSLKCCVEN